MSYACNKTFWMSFKIFFFKTFLFKKFLVPPFVPCLKKLAPSRPWHDAWVIACTHAITCTSFIVHPKIKLGWQNRSSRIHFNWFSRIRCKLILLTLLFKSLCFKTNLNFSYILLLDIFSIIMEYFCRRKKYLAMKGL